jgi:glycosyltransferase involved in cell wall biosynthesis
MPYAVIEAQYYGLPAIVTDIVGNRDIIDDFVSGFLVNTTKEFSEKIILLHDDDALYSNLSKNAKENIKRKHNVKNQSASIREVYMSKL